MGRDTSHRGITGKRAVVTEEIEAGGKGMVRIGSGEFWTARALHPDEKIERGARVKVLDTDGLTALVGTQRRRNNYDRPHRVGSAGAGGLLVAARAVRIIPQSRVAIVQRFGRYHRTAQSGLTLAVLIMDRMLPKTDLREQGSRFPATGCHHER